MEKPLLCIPNFSEGRDKEKIKQIAKCIEDQDGVYILDLEMDENHNRSVITILGGLEGTKEAIFEGIKRATEIIDLRRHQGVHPRIGATDVVPFIPLQDTSMDECVGLARDLGKRVGNELKIPVFLYEEAAIRPERRRLEEIRRGGLDSLRSRIQHDPSWGPDYGPAMIHPTAGAIVVGARQHLIAFNVNLKTPDIRVAKEIARRVRESSGGLSNVKAIGLLLENKNMVQVSMNLTNYKITPPHLVYRRIEEEAKRLGVEIEEGEIIGIMPEEPLNMAAISLLKLKGFGEDQILERRIAPILLKGESFDDLLASISSPYPAPGGGAVTAISGGLGAALAIMACGLTRDKDLSRQAEILRGLMEEFRRLADEDAMAYKKFVKAVRIPKEDPQRMNMMEESLKKASLIPLRIAEEGIRLLSIIEGIIPEVNKKTIPDLKISILMAISAAEGAADYVMLNIASLSDKAFIGSCTEKVDLIKTSLRGYKERLSPCYGIPIILRPFLLG